MCRRFDVERGDIGLEITEGALVNDMQGTRAALMRLRSNGFRISLDDFGTGYSSLSYLQNLPIDLMKIDRSFVKDLHASPGSRAIATAIISMGHTLGLRVLAEGVETEEQAAMLRQWGCEDAQGYLYARPMPVEQFGRYLIEHLPEVAKAV
jgi:EAL domain-containing protein (putative c-di-GMP-specific phosphodiesterase class I)